MTHHLGFWNHGLALWGETVDATGALAAAAAGELRAALAALVPGKAAARAVEQEALLFVPHDERGPILADRARLCIAPAATLAALPVAVLHLEPRTTVELLARCAAELDRDPDDLAADPRFAADLRFFVHLLRLVARVVLEGRYVPGATGAAKGVRSCWVPVLRDEEHALLRELASAMPASARALAPAAAGAEPPLVDPAHAVQRFVGDALDTLVRIGANEARQLGALPAARVRSQHDGWIRALSGFDPAVAVQRGAGDPLVQEVAAWQRPLELSNDAPVRLVLRLEEPADGAETWRLACFLRVIDDPATLVGLDEALREGGALLRRSRAQLRELALIALSQAAQVSPLLRAALGEEPRGALELALDDATAFLTRDALALEQAGFAVQLPAWWVRRAGRRPLAVRGRLRESLKSTGGALSLNDLVTVDWEVALGDQTLTHDELRELARQKRSLVRLRGQWIELDPAQLEAALKRMRERPSTTARVQELIHLSLGIHGEEEPPLRVASIEGAGPFGELFAGLARKESFAELSEPAGFRGSLRPYQRRGFSWLAFLRRFGLPACLADDMGLGKTVQALALLAHEQAAGETRPTLLVCPTSLVGNWQREAARFAPGLRVMVHHGLERQRDAGFVRAAQRHALVVTTYSLLSRDGETLATVPWAGVILDEAQNVKNPDTKQARAARALPAEWRLVMTGTPVENHVGDLWSLFQFLAPGLLPAREAFLREFLLPIRVGRDPEALARLKRRTAPFILRRLKSDPAILPELPKKLEHKVICSLTREQASLYAAVVEEMTEKLRATQGIERRGAILAGLTRLKQACNHPVHLLGDGSPLAGRSGKLERATEMLAEAVEVGDRALVFTQYREMGDLLQRHLALTLGCEVAFLHGGTPASQRQALVDRFQDAQDGPPIFVLSLRAGGTGLNLTRAAHVFHFDRWWNPAVEAQATDRAHRIGQTRQLQVHLLVCAGTLEERIDTLLERKREVAEQVVGSGEQWLAELSTDQLRELIALDEEAVAE